VDIEEYRNYVLNEVRAGSASGGRGDDTNSAGGIFTEQAFFEKAVDMLVSAEEIPHADACSFQGRGARGKALRVDGYSFVDSESLLCLYVLDYRGGRELESLTQTDVDDSFSKLGGFLEAALSGRLHGELEESSPGFGLAQELAGQEGRFSKVRLYLLSDAQLSSRVKEYDSKQIGDLATNYRIWDIARFHRVAQSQTGREEIVIDFKSLPGGGLPCLPAHVPSAAYKGYLCVVPVELLASIYDRHGDRLLEQNVRTYLQERGNVNKGIRNSLVNAPDMFFAYNNGISATATKVTVAQTPLGQMLTDIVDLQIVNGGQTTASVYWAGKRHRADLSRVFIQMKLSVIEPERALEAVPKISEYANSQNKVSAADFFANHPFHLEIEKLSRRILAPASGAAQFETHWFYERARGQYLNSMARLTEAAKRKFQQLNPPSQVITKTDLAKFRMSWDGKPHVVSRGAQKNFAYFAPIVQRAWDEKSTAFNEYYFKESVVLALLFKGAERIVSEQTWYEGGYRANIVTYTVASLARLVAKAGVSLDTLGIWSAQQLSEALSSELASIAKPVRDVLVAAPPDKSNVTEWAKLDTCWDMVCRLDLELSRTFRKELIDRSKLSEAKKDAEYTQKIDDGIKAQTIVLETGAPFWKRLWDWGAKSGTLTPTELSILKVACDPRKIPSELQAKRILDIRHKAIGEGFNVDG
jgi:hypothetical protein